MKRARLARNVSLATRLSLVALLVTLVSLAITATVGLTRGSELADQIADERFVTVAASRGDAVEAAAQSIQRELVALAASPATRDAITDLGDAYRELDAGEPDAEDASDLTEFYLADVVPALENVRSAAVGVSFLVPNGAAAVHLQSAFTVPRVPQGVDTSFGANPIPIDPALVLDPGDGSTYSALHPGVHQVYAKVATQSGMDDLFLIDARGDTIVYSVRKRIDFATSLDLGPHSGSPLARLVESFDAADGPVGRFSDFSRYIPAIEHPTVFAASPVFDGDTIVGYVAAAHSVDRFDRIMSGDGAWAGFGDSGDSYLVGTDAAMRSTARLFLESAPDYLAATTEDGPAQLDDAQRRRMAATGTTALVQSVDRRLLIAAAEQGSGLLDIVDHLGLDARAAYLDLDVEGVDWIVVAQVERDELDRPIAGYARNILFAVALFVVVVTFVTVRWANRLMAPIRRIAERLRQVRAGAEVDGNISDEAAVAQGPSEYQELSENVDQMLHRLAARRKTVETRAEERTALLREFLPAAIARRSEEGDGEVLDHVHNATVVVLTLEGLGSITGNLPDEEVRRLLGDIVDEVDALAVASGVERIKLTGSSYYAVCGVGRPYLDHAPRAVKFALTVRDTVGEFTDRQLALRGGVASGPVSVGLASRSALVYDVWGATVTSAETLARSAPIETILVADDVRAQLPSSFVVAGDDGGGAVAVTAHIAEHEARA